MEIAEMLKTPEKIRELQRKLYQKAKQEKEYRFYLLYDKVYRLDILSHAYRLVRANKGAPGIDGVAFEAIEKEEGGAEKYLESISEELKGKTYKPMPVRRVYIPKSDGGKRPLGIPAIEDITLHLNKGYPQVIDADISKYFDTIPHDKLLKLVTKRIVDKHMLKLIKMWLNAPVVEERADGKKEYRGNDKGTPQGGVISPLLANIYLNVLDTLWKVKEIEEKMRARLVRYADDFVVLCKGKTERILEGIKRTTNHLGLSLNEKKSTGVEAREGFNFLGFNIKVVKNPKTGKPFPLTRPSKKSMKHIRAEIKAMTNRTQLALAEESIIK